MGPGLGGLSTGVLEDVTCRPSRVGDRITAESKALTLNQRRTRSASPGEAPELLLRRLSMANRAWSTLSFSTNIHGELPRGTDLDCMKAVRELPGVVVKVFFQRR